MTIIRYRDLTIYRRLIRQVRPWWPHIAGLFILSLLASPIALLDPLPLQIAVDNVVGSQPLPAFYKGLLPSMLTSSGTSILILAAGFFVVIGLLDEVQWLASSLLGAYTSERMVLAFRTQLFHHAQRLSLSYHDTTGTADSTYRIQYDA